MKDKGAAAPRPCMGCKDVVRLKSHAGSVSHPRMWDVRRAQSEQIVSDNTTWNFRSLRPSWTFHFFTGSVWFWGCHV